MNTKSLTLIELLTELQRAIFSHEVDVNDCQGGYYYIDPDSIRKEFDKFKDQIKDKLIEII